MFVTVTGAVLSAYTGLALTHFGLREGVLLACALVVIVCPLMWLTCASPAACYRHSDSDRDLCQKSSFPFIAPLLLITFIPEFWFGNPSLWRIILILSLTAGLWCFLLVVVSSARAQRLLSWAESHSSRITSIIVALHTILFTSLIVARHYYFGAALGEDTGYYNQVFWNTLHGDFFQGSLTQDRYNDPPVDNEFALHNSPVLFLLLPLYWLYPSFYTLLVLKTIALSVSAIPLFLLVRDKISGLSGVVIVVAYVFSRNILNQSINAFHSIDFIAVFLLFTFLFFERGRIGLFLLFLLLSLTVREEVALTVWLFGLYAIVRRRHWSWVVCPVVMCAMWWYCSAEFVLVRSQIAMEGLDEFFSVFGKGRNEILATVVREPQKLLDLFLTNQVRGYFYEMVRPAAFLPLASMVGLFALPTMAMNSLIGAFWPSMINITNHYSLIATVCLFVGLVEAIGWIGRYSRFFNLSRQTFCLGIACLVIPEMAVGLKDTVNYGNGKQGSLADDFLPKSYAASLTSIVDMIEPNAAVAAPGILLPQLSYRTKLYYSQALWRYYDAQFDYLVLETDPKRIGARGCEKEKYEALIAEVMQSSDYKRVFDKDGFEIYKKARAGHPLAIFGKYACQTQMQKRK